VSYFAMLFLSQSDKQSATTEQPRRAWPRRVDSQR
jgi:hypothetical protein